MTLLFLAMLLFLIYGIMLLVPRCRKWWHVAAGVTLLPVLLLFLKREYGAMHPGAWFERGEYYSFVTLRMQALTAPRLQKHAVGYIHAKYSSGDWFGPMIRIYRLIEINKTKIDGLVLFDPQNKIRIRLDDSTAWEVEMLPGSVLSIPLGD